MQYLINFLHNYAITHKFFELQTPDFAWKIVWIVQTNYEKKITQLPQKEGASMGSSSMF